MPVGPKLLQLVTDEFDALLECDILAHVFPLLLPLQPLARRFVLEVLELRSGFLTVTSRMVVFENYYTVSDCYWTSTTHAADTTLAWAICSHDSCVHAIAKPDLRHSLAVRWRLHRRTPRHPAYVATSDSTAQPRITTA